MRKKPLEKTMAPVTEQEPKKRGRPFGTSLPPEERKSEMLHIRVTPGQREKWDEMEAAEDRFRTWLDRAKV